MNKNSKNPRTKVKKIQEQNQIKSKRETTLQREQG
jgi:hypothetical protein